MSREPTRDVDLTAGVMDRKLLYQFFKNLDHVYSIRSNLSHWTCPIVLPRQTVAGRKKNFHKRHNQFLSIDKKNEQSDELIFDYIETSTTVSLSSTVSLT